MQIRLCNHENSVRQIPLSEGNTTQVNILQNVTSSETNISGANEERQGEHLAYTDTIKQASGDDVNSNQTQHAELYQQDGSLQGQRNSAHVDRVNGLHTTSHQISQGDKRPSSLNVKTKPTESQI